MMKYSEDTAKRWFDGTFDLICAYLDFAGVPYILGKMRTDGDVTNYTRQICFPWCEGDVIVGCVHAIDIDILYGSFPWERHPFPSIETYRFPWDNGDITVFDSPIQFVKKIVRYYHLKMAGKEELA